MTRGSLLVRHLGAGSVAAVAAGVVLLMPLAALAQRADPGITEADHWVELPTEIANGRTDMATASLEQLEGATAVRLRAVGGDVKLSRMELVLKDGSTQEMALRTVLGVGTLTEPIRLPRTAVAIRQVRIFVQSTSPFGEARRVSAYATGGRQAAAGAPSAPETPRGWIPIGARRTEAGQRRETIVLGRDKGRFVGLAIRARDGAITLKELQIVYGTGEAMVAKLTQRIEADHLSPPLRVNADNTIHQVHVTFDVADGTSSTRPLIELLGAYEPDYVGNDGNVISSNGGWLMLGVQTAAMSKAASDYTLGAALGGFTRLRVKPINADAEIRDVYVTLRDGRVLTLPVNQVVRAGEGSPLIELPREPDGTKPEILRVTINNKERSRLRGDTIVEVWGQY